MNSPRHRRAREYLTGEPGMFLPGWLAAWLMTRTNLREVRRHVHGGDRVLDEALLALAALADSARGSAVGSVDGTALAVEPEPAPVSIREVLTVAEAAGLIGVTDRAVRKAIEEDRLAAERVAGRLVVARDAAVEYAQRRSA